MAFTIIGLAFTAALGYAIAEFGALASTALPALVFLVLFAARPAVGMVFLVATIPLEAATILPGGTSAARLVGLVVAGSWILRKLVRRRGFGRVVRPLSVACAIFVLYASISTNWGVYPARVGALATLSQLLGFTVIIADLANTPNRVDAVVKAFVLGALVAASLVIGDYILNDVKRAGDDVTGGVNATARLLVTVVPFAFYLLSGRFNTLWRVVASLYIILAIVAVALTFSRSSLLMLALIITVFYATMLRGRARVLWLSAPALVLVALLSVLPTDDIKARIATIGPYLSSTFSRDAGELSSSRGFHVRVALAIFEENPILGAGYGNYGPLFLDYQWQLAGGQKIWRSPRSPHGSHFGILADLGLVGMSIWLTIFALAFRVLWCAARHRHRSEIASDQLVVKAVSAGLLIEFSYGFTGQVHTEKHFWLVIALVLVVQHLYGNLARGAKATLWRATSAVEKGHLATLRA